MQKSTKKSLSSILLTEKVRDPKKHEYSPAPVLDAGGKPSTWFPPGGHVEPLSGPAGGSALLDLYVSGDDHDSTSNAVFVSQGGLSLPSRDYYIDKDIETDPTLQALVNHIANANHLADPATVPSAAAYFPQAAAIVALESSLATAQLSRVAMRDPEVLREPSPFLSHFYKCYTETHKINKTCSGQT